VIRIEFIEPSLFAPKLNGTLDRVSDQLSASASAELELYERHNWFETPTGHVVFNSLRQCPHWLSGNLCRLLQPHNSQSLLKGKTCSNIARNETRPPNRRFAVAIDAAVPVTAAGMASQSVSLRPFTEPFVRPGYKCKMLIQPKQQLEICLPVTFGPQ
jgi:hypothetical protein